MNSGTGYPYVPDPIPYSEELKTVPDSIPYSEELPQLDREFGRRLPPVSVNSDTDSADEAKGVDDETQELW
jgi:hypothetical protein